MCCFCSLRWEFIPPLNDVALTVTPASLYSHPIWWHHRICTVWSFSRSWKPVPSTELWPFSEGEHFIPWARPFLKYEILLWNIWLNWLSGSKIDYKSFKRWRKLNNWVKMWIYLPSRLIWGTFSICLLGGIVWEIIRAYYVPPLRNNWNFVNWS